MVSSGCRFLMYHSLCASVDGDKHGIYKMRKELFEDQMDNLKVLNKDIVHMHEWSKNDKSIVISFDDGFQDIFDIAAPILSERNMPFTVFVTPRFIMRKDHRYLDQVSLIELSKINGCTIGAHGYTHKPLTECTNTELLNELVNSKKWLEDKLSIGINTMSYPHGAVDQRVRYAVENAGYLLSASSQPGVNYSSIDPLWLNRTDIWSIDNMNTFEQKVKGYWDWMKWMI